MISSQGPFYLFALVHTTFLYHPNEDLNESLGHSRDRLSCTNAHRTWLKFSMFGLKKKSYLTNVSDFFLVQLVNVYY